MEFKYDDLVDEQLIDECEQVRSIAKKSWLNSAHVSLAHLDSVKAKVYNVGLADTRDLRGTNLRERKQKNVTELQSDPPLTTKALQNHAWGSNNSIPELIKQLSSIDNLKKPRPSSAKYGNKVSRPPSGRKSRPQSANEPLLLENANGQAFGVKGAKYDPSGRPPKGVSNVTSTGWVGPPAGMKYPDRPDMGQGWKMGFPDDEFITVDPDVISGLRDTEPPPPPHTSPVPQDDSPRQEEKTKRVMELYIGDPYKAAEFEDNFFEDSDDEFYPPTPVEQILHATNHTSVDHIPAAVLLRKPVPGTHQLRTSSDMSNREPIVEEAAIDNKPPSESLHLSLPVADDEEESDEIDTDRLLEQANVVARRLDQQQVFKLNTGSPQSSNQKQELNSKYHVTADSTNKNKAEKLVHKIITENGLQFDSNNKRDGITSTNTEKTDRTEFEKSGVKFSEDKNVTVNITPRNLGRKVTELRHNKKKSRPIDTNSFVDLIEVKNRIEPLLMTEKAPLSPRKLSARTTNRPPSGKLKNIQPSSTDRGIHSTSPSSNIFTHGHAKGILSHTNNRPTSATAVASRPKSAPLNRASKPITKVTVDYGNDEGIPHDQELEVKKKVRPKSEDVVTMMQRISMADSKSAEGQSQNNIHVRRDNSDSFENCDQILFEVNTIIPTVLKSEPEKNYYEISRHSSMSNNEQPQHLNFSEVENNISENYLRPQSVNKVFKTTKTLEFDELQPKEITVKSLIDAHVSQTKEKERFLASTSTSGINESRGRPPSRPPSGKKPVSKQPEDHSLERPGSRIGFVAMAPDKEANQKPDAKLKRPSSAPTTKRPPSSKGKENRTKTPNRCKTPDKDGKKNEELTDREKEEREKVIDNLLNRTKNLLGETKDEEEKDDSTKAKPKIRPLSAVTGLTSRCKDHRRINSAGTTRTASIHKHYAAYSSKPSSIGVKRPKSARKVKSATRKPCVINTIQPDYEDVTEEDAACANMEQYLADKGLNVAADTLQRALYPPSGRSKYYQITASLPKKSSTALLSHPKVWLPQEYKTLQKADKQLTRANEIMYRQRMAELKRAKLAELGPDGLRKRRVKKKGSAKKVRKSVA